MSLQSSHIQKWSWKKSSGENMNRNWNSVNLTKQDAYSFRTFLSNNKIRFETSENGNLIHFEVLVNDEERKVCDDFLSRI